MSAPLHGQSRSERFLSTLRHPLIAFGVPHLYVSYAGYLCWAKKRGRVWHSGVLISRFKVWRER